MTKKRVTKKPFRDFKIGEEFSCWGDLYLNYNYPKYCRCVKIDETSAKEVDGINFLVDPDERFLPYVEIEEIVMSDKFTKNKVTVELEIETQFGPADAISMVDTLTRVPAVTGVTVTKIETDWKPETNFNPELNVNYKAVQNVPRKIR